MNLWEYLAFGGLERVLLIGAAILISYWGYHLYSKAQIAGLSMIAVAALLLMSVVLTSGQHQESVSAGLLASNTATMPAPPQPAAADAIVAEVIDTTQPQTAAVPAAEILQEATAAVDGSTSADVVNSPSAEESAVKSIDTAESAAATPAAQIGEPAASVEPARIERLVPLASGSELGGQIVSVRSENVTLEWSAGDSRRRVISESSKQ
jgi:hypothetical protein